MSAFAPVDEILIAAAPGETRAALVAQGALVELIVERPAAASLVGNIYLGRVTKLVPSMAAAFVELGAAGAGFLALDDAKHPLGSAGPTSRQPSEGEAILVQVVKDGFGTKSPSLSTELTLPGRWLVYSPNRAGLSLSRRIASTEERTRLEGALAPHLQAGEGAILRTAAEGVDGNELAADLASLRAAWQGLMARAKGVRAPALVFSEPDPILRILRDHGGPALRSVTCEGRDAVARAKEFFAQRASVEVASYRGAEPLFAHREIEDQIAAALAPRVELPSGGVLSFGAFEALTAIDVDSARQAGAGRFVDNVLALNLEAAAAIARQVRLRNIAGLIVIDFVHMESAAQRARVADVVRAAFAGDPAPVRIGGFTPLGLFEMTRKRVAQSLAATLLAPCDACEGAGLLKSAATVAYEILRGAASAVDAAPGKSVTAIVSAPVAAALDGEAKEALRELERWLGRPLKLRVETAYGRETFDIVSG